MSVNYSSGVHELSIMHNESFYPNDTFNMEEISLHSALQHPIYMVVLYSVAYVSIMICAICGNVMVVAVVVRNQGMHTVTNYFIVNLAIADIMVALICLPMTLLNNLYIVAYVSIMICAICGNVMVVAVVVRNQGMHTVTNYFIVNLAIADIMVALICLPMTLLNNLYIGWHFGWFMCKATAYLQGVSVCASVTTLAAIAVDKYLAICHSMSTIKINKKICTIIIFLIWVTAFSLMIPWAMYYKVIQYADTEQMLIYPVCFEHWPTASGRKWFFLGALFLCCYSVPLILIVVCYLMIGIKVWRRRAPGEKTCSDVVHKSKVKAVKMLFCVVLLFAFSWLPLYSIRLQVIFFGQSQSRVFEIINPIAQWLGSSNSGMNPFIYCFFSKRYRRGFKDVITTCCRGREGRLQRRGLTMLTAHSFHSDTYANGHSRRVSFVYGKKSPKSSSDNVNSYV